MLMKSTAVKMIFLFLAVLICNCNGEGRWSRQLNSDSTGDWVPIDTVSINKRQTSGRTFNQPSPFQSAFYSPQDYIPQDSTKQLYLQSVPSGQQAFVNQPVVQFALTNPQYNPLAQAFIPAPPGNIQYPHFQRGTFSSQIIQNPAQLNDQFYSQEKKPIEQKVQKPETPRYIDGYKVENVSAEAFPMNKKKPVTPIAKTKYDSLSKSPQIPNQKATERASTINPGPTTPAGPAVEKEEVQLLYVPLETLQKEQYLKNSRHGLLRDSIGSPGQINNQLYASTTPNYSQRQQTQLQSIHQELIQQAINAQALQGKFQQTQFIKHPEFRQTTGQTFSYSPTPSTVPFTFAHSVYPGPVITTPKSKKLKAHQPPLAIYMTNKSQEKSKLIDVLHVLKDAKSISVLDTLGPNSPKVFIGPSTLRIPNYYSKFELPYLSGIDGNRIQRNIDKLPFFVAPLSYKAPEGFAKIPFPSPHVGSVIINPFMEDIQNPRPTPIGNTSPNSFSFSTFQHNPSTEAYRSTSLIPKQSTFNNYFSSATPNPVTLPQNTIPTFQTSVNPFEQHSFNTFRPLPTSGRPEQNIISTSKLPPLSSYFTPTSPKPTVSYFSFSSPEFSSIPTTPKTPSTQNYQYRGHYITNAAVDLSDNAIKTITPPKDINSKKPQTTPIPTSPTLLESHNAYSINHAFEPTTTEESIDIKNDKVNEVHEYNTEREPIKSTFSGFSQFVNTQKPTLFENNQFSSIGDFSPISYYGSTSSGRPNEIEITSDLHRPEPIVNNFLENQNSLNFIPNKYSISSSSEHIDENESFTEIPTTNEIPTHSTTTTTTVTPVTKITRRPIHLRGRPRYSTTIRPDVSEQASKPTTRRTPIRERRPNNFRSRPDISKNTNVDVQSVTENSDYELSKKSTDSIKTSRYSSTRNKAEDEIKSTTESSLPRTSALNRNQRLRSRGKVHFKLADNYDGSEYVSKNSKKTEKEDGSLAYQRDVLHQNYPVTLTEKTSSSSIQSSTINPINTNIDLTNGKIRIYETTGKTQKPYITSDEKEVTSQYYEKEPIFQGEQQKYLTKLESFGDYNNERSSSTLVPELYFVSKDSSTIYNDVSGSSNNFEKEPDISTTISNNINKGVTEKINVKIESENFESSKKQSNYNAREELPERSTESSTFVTPIARFRSKIRTRPKFLLTKDTVVDIENSADSFNKNEETTENNAGFTRRSSSIQPVTYRPTFDKHRTTMKIEDIEAELKSSRQQLRSESHSTTFKYPVYIPESTSSSLLKPTSENSEVTTKRNHFVRRRPTRPSLKNDSGVNYRSRTTTETPIVESTTIKKIKVRGRIRTRPTTTEKIDVKNDNVQETTVSSDDKYTKVTERLATHRYTSRGRLAPQKNFKGSPVEKNTKNNEEVVEDQATYDSINRPEYIEYKINNDKGDYPDYNHGNTKGEAQWSPKLSHSSFKPIFNPNLIADELKSDGIEYGTKIPSSNEESEIITARNPYDDVLISVTPANFRNEKSTIFKNIDSKATYKIENEKDVNAEKESDLASSFESVLEEVMRNLEQQDENEYNNYETPVVKHEGGEMGSIQPENTNNMNEQNTERQTIEDFNKNNEDRIILNESENLTFSSEPKSITSTERHPRRRGVWRRVRVRPVNRNMFETAESQYYGKTNNELLNNDSKNIAKTEKNEKININKENVSEKKEEEIISEFNTTPYSTTLSDFNTVTEIIKKMEDTDFRTESPDILLMNKENNYFDENIDDTEPTVPNEHTTYTNINDYVDMFDDNLKDKNVEKQNKIYNSDNTNKTETDNKQSIDTEIDKKLPSTTEDDQFLTTIPITESVNNEESSTDENKINNDDNKTEYYSKETATVDSQNEENTTNKPDSKPMNKKDFNINNDSIENTSDVNFWDPQNIISTSMSTEISHETEICYRGRCIKTKQDPKKVIS